MKQYRTLLITSETPSQISERLNKNAREGFHPIVMGVKHIILVKDCSYDPRTEIKQKVLRRLTYQDVLNYHDND